MKTELKDTLSWEIEEKKIFIDGSPSANFKALTRSDNDEVLSIMTGRYKTFTNQDLVALSEKICKAAKFRIAGYDEFQKGRKVIAYLENKTGGLEVNGHQLKEYLTIGNTHDGSGCVFIGTANYLFRCENQFSRVFRVFDTPHTRTMNFDSAEIKKIVEQFRKGSEELYRQFELMKQIKANQRMIDDLVNQVLERGLIDSTEMKASDRETLLRAGIGKEMEALGNNAWGLFNGVTWYTSHDIKNNRASIGNVNGVAQEMNNRAFKFCSALPQ